ncbi:MAG: hypothetical protein OXI88_21015 [Gammaproteobacteria bacterium]|nr:hypothetical protein [Gammaproteobacteria bacterium]MDE0283488.1 hypothetical protein [Gammaproteobacteria bacterium]MDE0514257.1 hypothetical protein [Gammaproteobacteria bacterium]
MLFNKIKLLATLLLTLSIGFCTSPSGAIGSGKLLEEKLGVEFCKEIYDELDLYYPHGLTEPYVIEVDLIFESLSHIDAQDFEFDLSFLMFSIWEDPRFTELLKKKGVYTENGGSWLCDWAPQDVWTETKKIFDPVLQFQNTITTRNFHESRADWIEVFTDGTIQARLRDTLTFDINFDLRRFPFDTQSMQIVLSTVFDTNRIILKPHENMDKYKNYDLWQLKSELGFAGFDLKIPEWTITDLHYYTHHIIRNNDNISELIVEIQVKRNYIFYFMKIILPVLFMFFICWSVLWIHPAEVQTSTNIAIVGFLSLITYNFMLVEDLPKVSYITIIDVFIFITYFYIGMSVLCCSFLHHSYLHRRELTSNLVKYFRIYGLLSYIFILLVSLWYFW